MREEGSSAILRSETITTALLSPAKRPINAPIFKISGCLKNLQLNKDNYFPF